MDKTNKLREKVIGELSSCVQDCIKMDRDSINYFNLRIIQATSAICAIVEPYRRALEEISDNHFECDGGEACKAHKIAKQALKEGD